MTEKYLKRKLSYPKSFETFYKKHFDIIVFKKQGNLIKTGKGRGRSVLQKVYRKNAKLKNIDYGYFQIELSTKNRIEIHTYMVNQSIDPDTLTEYFNVGLFNFEVLENDDHIKISWNQYREKYEFGVLNPMKGMGFERIVRHYWWSYPDHYVSIFNKSPLRYLDFEKLSEFDLTKLYKNRDALERFLNHNMIALMYDFISDRADLRKLTVNRVKKYRKQITRYNLDYKGLMALIYLEENNCQIHNIDLTKIKCINTAINVDLHIGISITKIYNYITRQKKTLSYYYDYLHMLEELKVPAETNIEFFPKKLEEAHDNALNTINLLKKELAENEARQVIEKSIIYEFSGEEYSVVVPKQLRDIVEEGKALQHCVGSDRYLNRHKKGESLIMFVRKNNDLEKPMVTFSFDPREKSVTQIHGFGNLDETKKAKPEDKYNFVKAKEFVKEEWLPNMMEGVLFNES